MKTLFFFCLLIFVLGFSSCEKVIDLPLNEAEQTLVVEAVMKDRVGVNYIILSKTGSVYQDQNFEKIEDATVTVIAEDGTVYDFPHQGNGLYKLPEFAVVPSTKYDIEINAMDRVVTATCFAPSKPKVDSLTYLSLTGTFGVPEGDTLNLISFHSVDNGAEDNYYLLKIFRNGRANSGYYLGNDDFINGIYYQAQFFGSEAKPRDTVLVEMISMDQANYNYYVGLSNNLSSGPFSAAPANPPSNLNGNALGFFGAYSTDTISIILP
ncbi:MAG: DUF4249 family protein [Crocinitomix sp.]|nr:DUF4249 family protein [Crocinitomix sp.]